MFAYKVTQNGLEATVELRGEGHMEHAGDLRSTLLNALENNRKLKIEASPETTLGLPIMQLLCSAHRMAHQLGCSIEVEPTSIDVLQDSVKRAGFCGTQGRGGPAGCVWTRRAQ